MILEHSGLQSELADLHGLQSAKTDTLRVCIRHSGRGFHKLDIKFMLSWCWPEVCAEVPSSLFTFSVQRIGCAHMSGEVAHLHNLQTRARRVQTSSSVPALRQFTCSSTALPLKKGGAGYLGKGWSVLGTLQPSQELRSESHPSPTASWGHSSAAVARVATTRVVPGISSVHAKLHSPVSVITRAAPPTRCFFYGPVHALCVAFPHLAASRQTS